jgi:hypothetical protein
MTNQVGSRDCMREEIARLSSGGYYNSPQDYLSRVQSILLEVDITFAVEPVCCYNDEGRSIQRLERFGVELNTRLYYTWYRMGSGRWEMVGYLT